MTSAPDFDGTDPRDAIIAGEIRAEIARQKKVQGQIAAEVFNRPPQWLNRRLLGEVPLTGAEILSLGDYLKVNVVKWLDATKPGPGGAQASPQHLGPKLHSIQGEGQQTPALSTSLRLVSLVRQSA